MEEEKFKEILQVGETIAVEFKRCGNGIESDTYETVCSFLNRFGGDIFMGVEDDGTVTGIPKRATASMIKNFISCVSNPSLFSPTVYIEPHTILYEGKTIIHAHVNPSAEVHTFKKVIFDRVDDADVRITATSQIAQMYIRKQNIFTERKIYPYLKIEDLRTDLFPTIRKMAVNTGNGTHDWQKIDDAELLRSAGLFSIDHQTGEKGLNLAAVLLLGKDDVIKDVAPAYETDCLLRRVNIDRYDDREVVNTNLVESYDRITAFIRKHLPDEFYLEDDKRVSLRGIIAREMTSNLLIHREFTSSFPAKFVIENKRIYCENANRASWTGEITPNNFEPNPKNPIIASFFRNIGLADRLGSGVRNMFKYASLYHGGLPQFLEQDIFRITVNFDEFVSEQETATVNDKNATVNDKNATVNSENATVNGEAATVNEHEFEILELISQEPQITYTAVAEHTGLHRATVARYIKTLAERRIIARKGADKNGYWEICKVYSKSTD